MSADDVVRDLVFVAHSAQASGAEKVMLGLVDLALSRGHRVRVACPEGPLRELLPASAGHVRIPELGLAGQRGGRRLLAAATMARHWLRAAVVLRALSRSDRAEIIVNSTMALPAVALALPRRRSAVWLVHDVLASRRQVTVARVGRAAVHRAVAVSERAAAPVRQLGFEVQVAVQGVVWPVEPVPMVERTPLVVGILGVITEWKGQHVLLAAAAGLPEISVEIAGTAHPGDEPYLAALRERSQRADLAGRVSFLGRVDAWAALREWDILVSASVLPEAGPLVVLEAMSLGVPVVATDHGGNVTEDVALCVPADDPIALHAALQRLVDDPQLRVQLSEAGRARVAACHDRSETEPRMLDMMLGSEYER
ncbi:glycosyltransferase family 4 protein [Nocardia mangyaensis]|uniref:glycosyltransferase family 4 protein n=1 Tax=Nocardia mangyaensis TaxID=2213200 RepID=UPI001F0A790F|nr:glycosyltransferase family 4 protein [Nocardia mangyaensis]